MKPRLCKINVGPLVSGATSLEPAARQSGGLPALAAFLEGGLEQVLLGRARLDVEARKALRDLHAKLSGALLDAHAHANTLLPVHLEQILLHDGREQQRFHLLRAVRRLNRLADLAA